LRVGTITIPTAATSNQAHGQYGSGHWPSGMTLKHRRHHLNLFQSIALWADGSLVALVEIGLQK
jgi:hypothetical protein